MYSIYKGFFYTKNRSGNARDMLGMEVIVLILLVLNIVVTVVTVWDVPRRVAEEEADAQALADWQWDGVKVEKKVVAGWKGKENVGQRKWRRKKRDLKAHE